MIYKMRVEQAVVDKPADAAPQADLAQQPVPAAVSAVLKVEPKRSDEYCYDLISMVGD